MMRRSVTANASKAMNHQNLISFASKAPKKHFASVVCHRQQGMGPGAEKLCHPPSSCLYVLGGVLHAPATRNAEFRLQGCEVSSDIKELERIWEP